MGAKGNDFKSLLTDKALPEWLDEITTDKDVAKPLPKKRARKKMNYDDTAYWNNIEKQCEDKGDEDTKSKGKSKSKKRATRKRKRNVDDEEGDEEGSSDGGTKRRKIVE